MLQAASFHRTQSLSALSGTLHIRRQSLAGFMEVVPAAVLGFARLGWHGLVAHLIPKLRSKAIRGLAAVRCLTYDETALKMKVREKGSAASDEASTLKVLQVDLSIALVVSFEGGQPVVIFGEVPVALQAVECTTAEVMAEAITRASAVHGWNEMVQFSISFLTSGYATGLPAIYERSRSWHLGPLGGHG
jgi:hypothetical protein